MNLTGNGKQASHDYRVRIGLRDSRHDEILSKVYLINLSCRGFSMMPSLELSDPINGPCPMSNYPVHCLSSACSKPSKGKYIIID